MNISIKGTNVIVLYGDGAAERFSDLVNRWGGMLFSTQWETFQFILVGSEKPPVELDENVKSLVSDQNTVFYQIKEPAPGTYEFHDLIYDKTLNSNVHLHLVVDAGGKPIAFDWLRSFIKAAMQVEALSTTCLYYLLFGRNSAPQEREEYISLLNDYPGSAFFLADSNENGGRVLPEERWHALELALLMNSAEALPVGPGAYSFGYSVLNANGSELRLLRESAACSALHEELGKPIQSFPESDLYLSLLPEGAESIASLRYWLQERVREYTESPKATEMKNAWITIRMDTDLSSADALKRMKRFVDLNYAANEKIRALARDLAARTESQLREKLRGHVITACLSDRVPEEIAGAFRQMVNKDLEPVGVTYPPKPFMIRIGNKAGEYMDKCKRAIAKSIQDYTAEKNISAFAEEMERAYMRLAGWLRSIQEVQLTGARRMTALDLLQSVQKELDGSDAGNALRLGQKYRSYQDALRNLHPSIQTLTEGIRGVYFRPSGAIEEKAWRELIRKAGENLEKKMPLSFRGDFFKVLAAEFDTTAKRELFFNEYLRNGNRMYRNLSAQQSNGTSVLLADNRLMDQWFMNREIYEVRTDNAENLTLYPLGSKNAAEYLEDTTVYFTRTGSGTGKGGSSVFLENRETEGERERPAAAFLRRKNSMFGSSDPGTAPEENTPEQQRNDVRLVPDEKNDYRLYWPWNRNDQTAMVEVFQFGEKVGKVAVIPVKRFHENGGNMNVSDDVMEGKPLPMGMLTVTIRDSKKDVYIEGVQVQGRREVVRYKVTNSRLQLKPESRRTVERLVLQTTDPDGNRTYYPLYQSVKDSAWLFEGMSISNGKITADPTQGGDDIFPVRIE